MGVTRSFKDIIAWQKAHAFVVQTYRTTRDFPNFERFGLYYQFQRAAVSIAANIAEGYRGSSSQKKLRFLDISQGSLEECRYYILLSKDLDYISSEKYAELNAQIEDASRLLNAYCNSIRGKM